MNLLPFLAFKLIAGIKTAALLWLLMLWLPAHTQVTAYVPPADARLKAVFLYNFTRHFEWKNESGAEGGKDGMDCSALLRF